MGRNVSYTVIGPRVVKEGTVDVIDLPSYSTDISAAWEVVEKMKQNGWGITIQAYGNEPNEIMPYEVTFGYLGDEPMAIGMIPEAISKAALLACLEVK